LTLLLLRSSLLLLRSSSTEHRPRQHRPLARPVLLLLRCSTGR